MTGHDTRELRTELEKWARSYEPGLYDGEGARRQLRDVARMKAIVASVETRLARRVAESQAWRRGGHKTPAHAIASTTGTSVGEANRVLDTAKRLEDLPDTADAFTSGKVTQPQAHEIASAASDVPEAERDLLATARERNHAQLREHAARVRASVRDMKERERHAHAQRRLRTYTDAEGFWHLHAKGAPSDGARIEARLNAEADLVFAEARKAGVRESREAYRFDALVRALEGATGVERAPATAHVYVNVDADLLTGYGDRPGARCEIKGIGPVPVDIAREYLGDSILTVLVKRGVDVITIAHDGTKSMPAAVRRAVLVRDQVCVVDTCAAPASQIHHVDWRSHGGVHSVTNCRGLCHWCHKLVHYEGYELEPHGDGSFRLRAPPP